MSPPRSKCLNSFLTLPGGYLPDKTLSQRVGLKELQPSYYPEENSDSRYHKTHLT